MKARRFRAFSLIELLVVVAIVGVLAALSIPAFNNVSQGSSLSRAGQDLADATILARQEAMTRNRKTYVRLVRLPDAMGGSVRYRGVQTWIVKDDAGTVSPLGRVVNFPQGIVLAEDASLSPLALAPAAETGSMTVAGAARDFSAFEVQADGSLNSAIPSQGSFLTLVQEKDVLNTASARPANFFSIFINPVTGEVSTFQP